MPYQAAPLDSLDSEMIHINPEGFDCVTFVEHVLALSLAEMSNKSDKLDSFVKVLRYRDGNMGSYLSRMHYFTEWIIQAEKNEIGRNISFSLGGRLLKKEINYMTSHLSQYPKVKNDSDIGILKNIESKLSEQEIGYIPKDQVSSIESFLQSGDILAFTTRIEGLDVIHTGFAFLENGKTKFIHASSASKKVVISHQTVHKWMQEQNTCNGLIVFRPGK